MTTTVPTCEMFVLVVGHNARNSQPLEVLNLVRLAAAGYPYSKFANCDNPKNTLE